MQRSAISSGGNLRVSLLGLLHREIGGQRDHAAQLGIVLAQALQINSGQPLGGDLALLNPAGELHDRGEGDVFVIRGQRAGIGLADDEATLRRAGLGAGDQRVPQRGRRERVVQFGLVRPDAHLVERRHRHAPVAGALRQLLLRVLRPARAFRPARRLRARPRARLLAMCRMPAARQEVAVVDFALARWRAADLERRRQQLCPPMRAARELEILCVSSRSIS